MWGIYHLSENPDNKLTINDHFWFIATIEHYGMLKFIKFKQDRPNLHPRMGLNCVGMQLFFRRNWKVSSFFHFLSSPELRPKFLRNFLLVYFDNRIYFITNYLKLIYFRYSLKDDSFHKINDEIGNDKSKILVLLKNNSAYFKKLCHPKSTFC